MREDHRQPVADAQDRDGLVPPEQLLGHRTNEVEVDDVVFQVHVGHPEALGQGPVERLLRDDAHLEQDLPQTLTRARLEVERRLERGRRDNAPLEKDVAEPQVSRFIRAVR